MRKLVHLAGAVSALSLVQAILLWSKSGELCDTTMAMDMHMFGFKTIFAGTGCVVLFDSSWTLSTRSSFLLAFACISLAAALTEALGSFRRRLKLPLVQSAAFTAHAALGYLLMLCAMTYQVEFFVAVVLGLGIGHLLFNPDATERADPCCPHLDVKTESSALLGGRTNFVASA